MDRKAQQERMDEAIIRRQIARSRLLYGAMAFLLSIILAIFSYNFFRNNENNLRNRKYSELAVIAKLKIKQIADWRAERLADVSISADDPFFIVSLDVLRLNPGDAHIRQDMIKRLKQIISFSKFQKIYILDPNGNILGTSNDDKTDLGENSRLLALSTLSSGRPVIGDITMSSLTGAVYMDFTAPIFNYNHSPLGFLIFRIDPNTFLFPLIQSWPLPSRTAESLLVTREGDDVVFLNPLLKRPGKPLSLRIPITSTSTPAVKAVLGQTGIFEGNDYAGDLVLADLQPVPDSDWFMVAKIDDNEAYAEIRQQGILGTILTVLVILFTLSAAMVFISYQQRHIYMDMFHAEQAKRQAQEEIRATLYGIGDGVIATDAAGFVTRLNPVAENLTGWNEADALGKPLTEVFRIINETSRQSVENPVQRVIQEGKVIGLANHTLLISRDGTEHAIADSAAPIKAEDGSLAGVVLVFRDQESERKSQKQLAASQKKFSSIFESSPDAIFLASVDDGLIIDLNHSATEMTGYTREDMIGRSVHDLGLWTNPEDRSHYVEKLRLATRVINFDTTFTSKTGKIIFTSIAGGIILLEDEEFVLSVVRDISALKEAREDVKEQQTLLRALIDNAPFEIWARDEKQVCILENRTLVERHGSILGTTPHQLPTSPEQMAKWDDINQTAYRGEVATIELEQTIFGEERIFDCIIAPILNEGSVTGIIGFNIDITQRKEAEKALAEEKEELERSNAELEQFAYVASHDLQEPLRMVSSYMQLLEKRYKGKLDSNADEFIGFAVDGAVRMQKLINDLLSFSRVGTRGKSLVPVSGQEAFDLALHNLKLTIEEHHAVITADKLPLLKGDATQLVQLFQNLVANAIKFHGNEPPVIHLSVLEKPLEWEFALSDNGIGIEPKHFERVFVLFQRLHERAAYPGTGIGLAVCKKIVQRHGGHIWLDSEPGKGTTFFFTFPKL